MPSTLPPILVECLPSGKSASARACSEARISSSKAARSTAAAVGVDAAGRPAKVPRRYRVGGCLPCVAQEKNPAPYNKQLFRARMLKPRERQIHTKMFMRNAGVTFLRQVRA